MLVLILVRENLPNMIVNIWKVFSYVQQCLNHLSVGRESTLKALKSSLQGFLGGAPIFKRMALFCKTNAFAE